MDLKKKYFGAEGELFKKKESLLKPIQDEIYNAVKEISENKNIQLNMNELQNLRGQVKIKSICFN